MLGVTERHVFNLKKDGRIPAVKLGRALRFDLDDVKRALGAGANA